MLTAERTPQDFTQDVRGVVHTANMADPSSAHLSSGAVLGLGSAHKIVSRLDFPHLLAQLQLLVGKGERYGAVRGGVAGGLGHGDACCPHRVLESRRCSQSGWVSVHWLLCGHVTLIWPCAALEENIPITDPAFYASEVLCPDTLIAHVFRAAAVSKEELPLLKERIAIMREVGSILCKVRHPSGP